MLSLQRDLQIINPLKADFFPYKERYVAAGRITTIRLQVLRHRMEYSLI